MWYDKPSSKIPLKDMNQPNRFNLTTDNDIWQQNTLPIGNGFIGANIYGEIQTERLSFNEKTLWNGGPSEKHRPNYNGGNLENIGLNGHLFNEVRRLFKEGKNDEAKAKAVTLLGLNDVQAFGSFQAFGELDFEFQNLDEKNVKNYVRSLDLDTALSYVSFEIGGTKYVREYFASFPENVICIKFTTTSSANSINKTKSKMSLNVKFLPSHTAQTIVEEDIITICGELEDNEMKFNGKIKVVLPFDGKITKHDEYLTIDDASEILFYVSAATDYKNAYPKYRTGETESQIDEKVHNFIKNAVSKGYSTVKTRHLEDYQNIFNRCHIDIGQEVTDIPTDQLLKDYNSGTASKSNSRALENLLFQYGRYLDIGSSRAGTLPPNLQGIWNDLTQNVPWECDYHLNINLQMNYFPTFVTNMFELGPPLIDFIESLQEPGRITAQIYTGAGLDHNGKSSKEEKWGFMAHPHLNCFGWTAPGWDFFWGWSPADILWILTNAFDYYQYTNDITLLKDHVYPMMREETFYFENILFTRDEKRNRTITSPTFSPEHGPPTNGDCYEQTILWQHYTNLIFAAETLNVDQDQIPRWKRILEELKPIEIGDSGQIKEWYEETYLGSMGDKNHRHMSHLLGLYPFDLINIDTKEWLEAAKVSMNDRGDKTTGWGMGQRINAWARTGDGNRAYLLIQSLLKNGIYSNLWDTHPPYQIDGNFAATSGIAEMLLQSRRNYIHLLPALPDAWKEDNREFSGLVAKGNIVVSAKWSSKGLTSAKIEPRFDCDITVRGEGITKSKITNQETGKKVIYSIVGEDSILFTGEAKATYVVDF